MRCIVNYFVVIALLWNSPRGEAASAKYQVTIKTSSRYTNGAGDRNWVYIEMFGQFGKSTGWKKLDNLFVKEFKRGDENVFSLKAPDVGVPWVIRLRVKSWIREDPWAVEEVEVSYHSQKIHFPIYGWVTKPGVSVMHGEAFICPNVINANIVKLFDQEMVKTKKDIPWNRTPRPGELGWGLPRYSVIEKTNELPMAFKATEVRQQAVNDHSFKSNRHAALQVAKGMHLKFTNFESYIELYEALDVGNLPDNMDRWKTDEEFGRQQLNGISPLAFERLLNIPDGLSLTAEDIENMGLLGEGKRFADELNNGKLYFAEYDSLLRGAKRNKNFRGKLIYCPDGMIIYHVNKDDNLVPIVIQLVLGDPEYVFTPLDSEDDWLLAKMHIKSSMASVHQWYYHFLLTHNVMEPFAVGLFRNLPLHHPIYKLLKNHLQTVADINQLARKVLIPEDSVLANQALCIDATDFIRRELPKFTMDDLVIPEVLSKRGLTDSTALPKYYYRDDALKLWKIQEDFVRNVINVYYKSDDNVASDESLQEFLEDVARTGLDWQADDQNKEVVKGIPLPMKTVDQLVRLCVSIMYTSSVQHAAVNFQQFEWYKYIPESPMGMRLPPHKKGEANMQKMMDSLPDIYMSTSFISLTYILSQYTTDEVFIGDYPQHLFHDSEVEKYLDEYKLAIDKYGVETKARNAAVEYPYIWLLPDKIPNSIGI